MIKHDMAVLLVTGAAAFTMLGCGVREEAPASAVQHAMAGAVEGQPASRALAAAKMRTYCKSCHAVGPLRFIFSDDDTALFKHLAEARSPASNRLWSEAIVDVLSWPTDAPPPADELKDPELARDWMPKGIKRLQLADDVTNGQAARRLILDALRQDD